MDRKNSGVLLLLLYIALSIYLMPIFSKSGSANDLTRWATTVSLVEQNSLDISWLKETVGQEFSDVTVLEDGKTYSNKSPGIAFLSAPFYAIAKVIVGKPTKENVRTTWAVMRFMIASLPLIVLAMWLLGMEVDAYSLAILLFATPLFPYSLLYYSHVLVAVLVYFAFRLIYDGRRVFPERCFMAGLLTGFALACEYSALIPLVVFGLGLFFTESRERMRRILFYVSGIAPFIFLLAVYNQLVFGWPFAIFSHYETVYPTPSGLYETLISASKGLFFFSPVLVFALLAVFDSEDRGFRRHRIKLITVFLTVLAVSGFAAKYSGDSIGARHLIIVVPLLLDSFFDGEVEDFPSILRGLLFAASFLFCAVPMLTYAFAPSILEFPHNSFWQTLLYDKNLFTLTIANTFGFDNNLWTILPAFVILLLVIYLVWRDAKFPFKFAVGLLLGFVVVGIYTFVPQLEKETAAPYIRELAKEPAGK